jgi:hypothetical protein
MDWIRMKGVSCAFPPVKMNSQNSLRKASSVFSPDSKSLLGVNNATFTSLTGSARARLKDKDNQLANNSISENCAATMNETSADKLTITELQQQITSLQADLSTQKSSYEQQLSKQQQQHSSAMIDLESRHKTNLERQERIYNSQQSEWRKEQQAALEAEIQQKFLTKIKSSEAEVENHMKANARLVEELAQYKGRVLSFQAKCETYQTEIANLNYELQRCAGELAKLSEYQKYSASYRYLLRQMALRKYCSEFILRKQFEGIYINLLNAIRQLASDDEFNSEFHEENSEIVLWLKAATLATKHKNKFFANRLFLSKKLKEEYDKSNAESEGNVNTKAEQSNSLSMSRVKISELLAGLGDVQHILNLSISIVTANKLHWKRNSKSFFDRNCELTHYSMNVEGQLREQKQQSRLIQQQFQQEKDNSASEIAKLNFQINKLNAIISANNGSSGTSGAIVNSPRNAVLSPSISSARLLVGSTPTTIKTRNRSINNNEVNVEHIGSSNGFSGTAAFLPSPPPSQTALRVARSPKALKPINTTSDNSNDNNTNEMKSSGDSLSNFTPANNSKSGSLPANKFVLVQ